jgi:hypothetical protein
MTRNNQRPTAYHEAGHAIVWMQTGTPFSKVWLPTTEEDSIHSGQVLPVEGTTTNDVRDLIAIALAGNIAQCKYLKKKYDHDCWHAPSYEDELTARERGKNYWNPLVDRTIKKTTEWTRDYLNDHWDDVCKIADMLLIKKSMTYSEVAECVAPHTEN